MSWRNRRPLNLASEETTSFGRTVGLVLLAQLSQPLDAVLNSVVLPIVNRVLERGYVIKPTSADLSGYTLSVNFTNPEIDMTGGTYALVGTDVQIALAPSPPKTKREPTEALKA